MAGLSPHTVGTSRPIAIDRHAQVAQSVEHVLGKDEVSGSIPLLGFALCFGNSEKVSSGDLGVRIRKSFRRTR
jgi:hypothetical protein